jgi:hypothetical protein
MTLSKTSPEKGNLITMEIVKRTESGHSTERDTLYMLGGVALVVVGAGMILSHPTVRRYVEKSPIGNVIGNIIPDVERYFKLRAM